jgi:hypothetical protein
MAPQLLELGDVLTVTMRIKNTGTVPIRNIRQHRGMNTPPTMPFIDRRWQICRQVGRVLADWGRLGRQRWGCRQALPLPLGNHDGHPNNGKIPFVEDEFLPGEECEIVGRIRIKQQETKMGFFVGLIQDGVGFFQRQNLARTIIKVGF